MVGYWDNIGNQKRYVEWLSTQLNITRLDDWYEVKTSQIVQCNLGLGFLHKYNFSLYLIVIVEIVYILSMMIP